MLAKAMPRKSLRDCLISSRSRLIHAEYRRTIFAPRVQFSAEQHLLKRLQQEKVFLVLWTCDQERDRQSMVNMPLRPNFLR
jgi:hypothetical protein